MKIKVFYTALCVEEIEVDDKFMGVLDSHDTMTEEEWERHEDLTTDFINTICESDKINNDGFIEFQCAKTLSEEILYEW